MTRFERATPSSQARCATKLRYIPVRNQFKINKLPRQEAALIFYLLRIVTCVAKNIIPLD